MLTPRDCEQLLADLRDDPGLTRPRHLAHGAVLPGGHLDLADLAAGDLLPALGSELTLRGLWLDRSELDRAHAEELAALLARHPALEHLGLAGNPLGAPGLAVLLPALAAHPGLRSLDLRDCDLDPAITCQIGHALKTTSLLHLRLAGNHLDPPSARAWADLLRQDPPWRGLSLPASPDPAPILVALADNTRLCTLDLGHPLPQPALARLCSNANRQRARVLAPDRARLRRDLPPLPVAPPPLPPDCPLDPADLDACERVLAALSHQPDLLRTDHPRLATLRAALLAVHRRERRDDRRLARSRRVDRRELHKAADRRRIDDALIRRRDHGVADAPPAPPADPTIHELHTARPCYICKQPYTRLHFFYDRLCPDCAARSYARRNDTLDLRGRHALVTGGRIKIGHQIALRLLAWGAHVVVTSRFPRDTARRFAAHPEFSSFRERLHVYPLDLRAIPHVEAFAAHLDRTVPALDILVNNAAQTVYRPPAYYAALLADEALPDALPPALAPLLPGPPVASNILPAEHPLFPQHSDDGFGQPLDLRERNSWRLRLDEVGTVELLEVQLINAVAPYVLCARLRRAMARAAGPAFIVNVSAPEGRFDRAWKSPFHPHTNMAKAALNMMTRTSAEDYARDAIYMTSVDTGWVSNENPAPIAGAMRERGFSPPLDLVDAATRVCDPIVRGLRDGELLHGVFFKDFAPITW